MSQQATQAERFEYAIELPGKGFVTMNLQGSIHVEVGDPRAVFTDYEETLKQYALVRRRYESMGAEVVGRTLVIRKRRIVTTVEDWDQVLAPSIGAIRAALAAPPNAPTNQGETA